MAGWQPSSMPARMHVDEVDVSEELVRRLLADQFPQWAGLPLQVVEPWGTAHGIWRLGDDLVVRLPRIGWATGQVERDARWLPILARHLTVAVPEPVAVGEPGHGYPFPWAVHRWLPGEPASAVRVVDHVDLALSLARVVKELRGVPVEGAPPARNRARPLADYDESTREAIRSAAHLIDADAALGVWEDALAAPVHPGPPRWVHGDLDANCLLTDGRLSGLVDWGSACVGDPAVDVQVIWTPLFTEQSRWVFLDLVAAGDAVVRRSRGAALHQACAALPYYLDTYPEMVERSRHKLAALGVGPTLGV